MKKPGGVAFQRSKNKKFYYLSKKEKKERLTSLWNFHIFLSIHKKFEQFLKNYPEVRTQDSTVHVFPIHSRRETSRTPTLVEQVQIEKGCDEAQEAELLSIHYSSNTESSFRYFWHFGTQSIRQTETDIS